jgi:hypothetical protein
MMVTDAWCSAAHKQEQHQGQHGDFRVVVFSYKSCEQPSTYGGAPGEGLQRDHNGG